MFRKLHTAYTDLMCNPFYIPGDYITSELVFIKYLTLGDSSFLKILFFYNNFEKWTNIFLITSMVLYYITVIYKLKINKLCSDLKHEIKIVSHSKSKKLKKKFYTETISNLSMNKMFTKMLILYFFKYLLRIFSID